MIRLSKPPWKDRKHLFTPSTITKYEFACARIKVNCSSCHCKMRVRPLPNGPVIHIPVYNGDREEDDMIDQGPQMPEDRSGEPDLFWLPY